MSTPPATDWSEEIPPDEEARLVRHAELLRRLQRGQARGGRVPRALHNRGLVAATGTLRVHEGLPPELAQGVFAEARTYPVYARFSNGSGVHQPDRKPDVRGMALKLVGVEGAKVIPDLEDARTQDFLFIQSQSLPVRNADEFVAIVYAASNPLLLLPRLLSRLGVFRGPALLRQMVAGLNRPFPGFASAPLYSALPLRYGDHACKLALRPLAPEPAAAPRPGDPDPFTTDLVARLRQGPLAWQLEVQLYRSPEATPIEDASRPWDEALAPLVPVATVTLPRQDVTEPRGAQLAAYVETLSFDPWHALVAHRPLGNMMRARNHAYRLSTEARGAAPEPEEMVASAVLPGDPAGAP
jgi:hypothetical protein